VERLVGVSSRQLALEYPGINADIHRRVALEKFSTTLEAARNTARNRTRGSKYGGSSYQSLSWLESFNHDEMNAIDKGGLTGD
jgi:hypothetical protein